VCDEQKDYRLQTVGHYVVIGGCVFSPVLYSWYKWLDKAFPGTTSRVVMKKASQKFFLGTFLWVPCSVVTLM
jgi:hypothetical protein